MPSTNCTQKENIFLPWKDSLIWILNLGEMGIHSAPLNTPPSEMLEAQNGFQPFLTLSMRFLDFCLELQSEA